MAAFPVKKEETKEKEKKEEGEKKSVYVNITIVSLFYLLCLSAICRLSVFIHCSLLCIYLQVFLKNCPVASNILVSDRT